MEVGTIRQVSIIIKPTKRCNAVCKHCSVDKNNDANMLTVADISIIMSNFLALPIFKSPVNTVEIIWHGGEPMLMQPSFYYEVDRTLSVNFPNVQFIHGMQSNFLLYNKQWHSVIDDIFQWRISSSYDFLSSFRQVKSQKTYYDLWMEKVKTFQDKTGQRLHTICILSKENIDNVIDICQIAYESGINIKLNELYLVGEATAMSRIAITEKEYGEALIKSFDFWVNHRKNGFIFAQGLDFDEMARHAGYRMRCPVNSSCTGYIFEVEPNGDLYNCGECADLKLNKFGNLLSGDFNILNYITMKSVESQILPECIKCGICGSGGCKKQKYMSYGYIKGKTPLCDTWKSLYNAAKIANESKKCF